MDSSHPLCLSPAVIEFMPHWHFHPLKYTELRILCCASISYVEITSISVQTVDAFFFFILLVN